MYDVEDVRREDAEHRRNYFRALAGPLRIIFVDLLHLVLVHTHTSTVKTATIPAR
jgi:hypothetical protein